MLDIVYAAKYKKDFRTCAKRHYDLALLASVVNTLRIPSPLEHKHRPHHLSGIYSGYYECQITPDWLLIYRQTETQLFLARTGTHADLFR